MTLNHWVIKCYNIYDFDDYEYSLSGEENSELDIFYPGSSESSMVEEISDDNDNSIVGEVTIEGYVKVTITVNAKLDMDSNVYLLNGNPLKIDSEIEITTKKYAAYGKCIFIEGIVVTE